MNNMFSNCQLLTSLDLCSFDTSSVTDMYGMFQGLYSVRTIYAGKNWSTANLNERSGLFFRCDNLKGGAGTEYNQNQQSADYARADRGTDVPGYFTSPYKVRLNAYGYGTVTADKTGNLLDGDTVTLTVSPENGYKLKTLTVTDKNNNSITVTDNNFVMPEGNAIVTAEFEPIDYTITLTNTGSGTVSAAPGNTAHINGTVKIFAEPADGWYLEKWQTVSGNVTLTPVYGLHEFKMPAENVELNAVFKQIAHSVTIVTDGHGTASADKPDAAENQLVTLSAIPETGWRFKEWQVLSGNVQISNDQFNMTNDNVTIMAVFEEKTYPITVSYGEGGTAQAYVSKAAAGTDIALVTFPEDGWQFKEWQVIKGNTTVTDDHFVMPAEETEIRAVFRKMACEICVSYTDGGTASANVSSAFAGEPVTLIPEPNADYYLANWLVTEGNVTVENNQFTMPATPVSVLAVFEKIPHTVTITCTDGGTAWTLENSYTQGQDAYLYCQTQDGYVLKEWQVISGNIIAMQKISSICHMS